MRYAIVSDGFVTNVIVWDGAEEYVTSDACILVESPEHVSIGWVYLDGEWIAPEAPAPEILPTESEEAISSKNAAVADLVATLGISEATARTIVGFPNE